MFHVSSKLNLMCQNDIVINSLDGPVADPLAGSLVGPVADPLAGSLAGSLGPVAGPVAGVVAAKSGGGGMVPWKVVLEG